jgi:hypothetical protein
MDIDRIINELIEIRNKYGNNVKVYSYDDEGHMEDYVMIYYNTENNTILIHG